MTLKSPRWLKLATLSLALSASAAYAPTPAVAQEPTAEGEPGGEKSGRPVDGYIATAILAFLALFIVCKSARR